MGWLRDGRGEEEKELVGVMGAPHAPGFILPP